jgi:hypothetical protein
MVKRIFCGILTASWNLRVEKKGRKSRKAAPIPWFLFSVLFLFLAPLSGIAQTATVADAGEGEVAAEPEKKPDAVVVVMPVKADDTVQGQAFQDMIAQSLEGIEGYTPRVLTLSDHPEYADVFPNTAPDPAYTQDSAFALTSEHYIDMDNRQHFQAWLWNSADGAPIYTDEMVFDDVSEGMDYLPGLISWIISLAPKEGDEIITREIVREIVTEMLGEVDFGTPTMIPESSYFHLYMGLRGGGSLNTYAVREFNPFEGSSEQGFGGELAFALELRPWRFLSFQAEALLFLETFNAFKQVEGSEVEDRNTPVRITSLSLLVPLLLKFPFEVGGIGLYFSFGPYFVLPLTQAGDLLKDLVDIDMVSYQMALPFGVCFGLDVGYRLGYGELFGSLRYNYDLGTSAAATDGPYSGLKFNRQRMAISFGFRIGLFETGGQAAKND